MKNENSNFVCVLKTGKTLDHDMAVNALEDKGVPFYREQETSSGLRLAMPFQSSMGPGIFYSILVPEIAVEDAKSVLAELPIDLTTNPDLWHFNPNKKAKRFWKIFIWATLGVTLLFLGFSLISP